MSEQQLIARAVYAYLTRNTVSPDDAPAFALCAVVTAAGRSYVVLRSSTRFLACYRVHGDGGLRRVEPPVALSAAVS